FLRTYAEQVGVDPHLLVEEYRLHHEPGGEGEPAPLAPQPRVPGRRDRRPATGAGPPSFGTLVAGFVVLVVAVLLVLGITGGGKDNSSQVATTSSTARTTATTRRHRPRRVAPSTAGVAVKIAPTVPTYACVDTG